MNIEIPSLDVMTKILRREEELRLSDKYQAMFANPGITDMKYDVQVIMSHEHPFFNLEERNYFHN